MGVIRDRKTGIYHARKKVPRHLETAVAQVLESDRPKVSWLKKSLGTRDPRRANIMAKPVLAEFDRVLARAEALVKTVPKRSDLSEREIKQMADYLYASILLEDDAKRVEAGEEEELFQSIGLQLREAGVKAQTSFPVGQVPAYGLSDRQLTKAKETIEWVLPAAREALARGDISFIEEDMQELLEVFRVRLDDTGPAYQRLGLALLRSYVSALEAVECRLAGEPVETPQVVEPAAEQPYTGETLSAALEGWKRSRPRVTGTVSEFEHAVRRFIELHGDLRLTEIKRSHVREFREALQLMPVRRSGRLKTATLPELVEFSRRHPDLPKISAGTVNKLLGGVQAVTIWARTNGLIPDDVVWTDPFSNMRLDEDEPTRETWEISELRTLFMSPVYTQRFRPDGGRGEAAYWLPLLALYTGARLGELAPLIVRNIKQDEATGIRYIEITEDEERGVRTKTRSSRRVVPLHPELVRFGFLQLVAERRAADGESAQLFPLLTPGPKGGYGEAWSKWFGRYIRSIGISNRARVFHSFRHTFKDALRAAGVSEDVNDALLGQSGAGGVGRRYGAKEMIRRFGLPRLAEAVSAANYPGLDLSHLYMSEAQTLGDIGSSK